MGISGLAADGFGGVNVEQLTYGMTKTVSSSFDATVARVRKLLAEEGFGVVTEIDVKETMKAKLDRDFSPYVILGACNPQLALQVLSAEPHLGLFLPCNVIIFQDAAGTTVSAMDPPAMLALSGVDGVEAVAAEVKARLERVMIQV